MPRASDDVLTVPDQEGVGLLDHVMILSRIIEAVQEVMHTGEACPLFVR